MERNSPNLGHEQLKVWTNKGKLAVATFQCADVTRPHFAASQRSVIREIELSLKVKVASSRVRTERARVSRGRTTSTLWRCTRKSRVSRGVGFCLDEQTRESRLPGELARPFHTSTLGGVERVTDEQTDKDEEQAGTDEPDETLDSLGRRVCHQPTTAEVRLQKGE